MTSSRICKVSPTGQNRDVGENMRSCWLNVFERKSVQSYCVGLLLYVVKGERERESATFCCLLLTVSVLPLCLLFVNFHVLPNAAALLMVVTFNLCTTERGTYCMLKCVHFFTKINLCAILCTRNQRQSIFVHISANFNAVWHCTLFCMHLGCNYALLLHTYSANCEQY